VWPICHGARGTRSRRQLARCEHRDGPRADPNGPKRNTGLRNTTRAEPSHTGQPAKSLAGQAAVPSANLRIDQLINTIQDIRRKNFATSLFQPVPGIYSYQTWARLPDYVPSATSRVRGIVTDSPAHDGTSLYLTSEFLGRPFLLGGLFFAPAFTRKRMSAGHLPQSSSASPPESLGSSS